MEKIQEVIEVTADFKWGKVTPISFVWKGRKFEVGRVTITFERKDGGRKFICFGVETTGMMAELAWDIQAMKWLIVGVAAYV